MPRSRASNLAKAELLEGGVVSWVSSWVIERRRREGVDETRGQVKQEKGERAGVGEGKRGVLRSRKSLVRRK